MHQENVTITIKLELTPEQAAKILPWENVSEWLTDRCYEHLYEFLHKTYKLPSESVKRI